jgi:ubiquinone/menaquinone biosynthesis C-methylase UbiE
MSVARATLNLHSIAYDRASFPACVLMDWHARIEKPMTSAQPLDPALTSSTADVGDGYVLGTDTDEAWRLGLQHRLWAAQAHGVWERCGIQPGQTIIDLGCGPGHAAMDLAQLVGSTGRVLALDESAFYLKLLNDDAKARKLSNITRILGNAEEAATLLGDFKGHVDAVYARWLLCFVPEPEKVVSAVASLLKPGGRFIVQDYFNYEAMTLAPRRPIFTKVVQAVAASWRARGGDPDIVARLPEIFRQHGLKVEHMESRERVARPGSSLWHWPETFFRNYVPKLVTSGFLSVDDMAAFKEEWARASANPDSFLLTPTVFDVVGVKA